MPVEVEVMIGFVCEIACSWGWAKVWELAGERGMAHRQCRLDISMHNPGHNSVFDFVA